MALHTLHPEVLLLPRLEDQEAHLLTPPAAGPTATPALQDNVVPNTDTAGLRAITVVLDVSLHLALAPVVVQLLLLPMAALRQMVHAAMRMDLAVVQDSAVHSTVGVVLHQNTVVLDAKAGMEPALRTLVDELRS